MKSIFSLEKKLIESKKKYRESEEKYSHLINTSPDSIVTTDLRGKIISCNKAAYEILGYSKEEIKLIGKKYSKIAAINKKERPNFFKILNTIIRGKKTKPIEFQITKKDGTKIYVETHISPIKENNKIIGIQAITRDINERKLAEIDLKNFNVELSKKVEERTRDIQKLLKQKDEFINQLGHDLKNPLNPLVNLLPIIENEEKDPEKKKILTVINRNVKYMKNLVTKTIELARLNSPNTEFNFKKTNLLSEMNKIIETNKFLFEEKNIQISNNIPEDTQVSADKLRLDELFNNLLNNSVKYSNGPGIITIDAKSDDEYVTVSISDTGIGMTNEQLSHVFDEFYKADESRHDFDSSGLGMPICKRIVERHGGCIWAESKGPGKGCTIYFTIPRKIISKKEKPDTKPLYNKTVKKTGKSTISEKVDMILKKNKML